MSNHSQFFNICKWQLDTDAGKILKTFVFSFILNALVLFGGSFIFDQASVTSVTDLSETGTLVSVSFCFSALQLFMLFAVCRLIAPMTNKNRRVQFLMMPASMAQKFTMRVLFLSVFCAVVWLAGFFLADAVHVLTASWFSSPYADWATPTMVETCQSMFTSATSPGETADIFMQGMHASRELSDSVNVNMDNAEVLRQSMEMPEELLRAKSFAEAGVFNVYFGLVSFLFSWSMCLLCGALFRTAPWVFAWIASLVLTILLAVADYALGLGKPIMAVFYTLATVAFVYWAYRLFKNTQVIHNKLLNV